MKKILLITLLAFAAAASAQAQKKTFVRDYTYQASEDDSRNSARANATTQMRNILLREVGEFLHTEQTLTTDNHTQEYTEKIEAITAGIVEMKTLDEQWNGVTYYIKAEMTVDPADLERRIADVLNDKQKTKELEEARKRVQAAEAEVARLRKELASSNSTDSQSLRNAYLYQAGILASDEYITRGNIAESNGWRKEAIAEYEKAYEQMPKNEVTCLFMVDLYKKIEKYDLSIKYYEKYIDYCYKKYLKTNPKDINMLVKIAESYIEIAYLSYKNNTGSYKHYISKSDEYYEMAEQECKNIVLGDPNNANVYIKLANVYFSGYNNYINDKYRKMFLEVFAYSKDLSYSSIFTFMFPFSFLEDVISSSSHYPDEIKSKINSSIIYFKKALELEPNNAVAHIKLADLYTVMGRKHYSKAVSYYEESIKLNPNNVAAHIKLADLYTVMGRKHYSKAVSYYEKAIKLNPNNADARIKLAYLYTEMGRKHYSKAVGHYEKAIEIAPNNATAEICERMGFLYKKLKNKEESKKYYEKARQLKNKK
jgi:tetratricopeptide (TPR) repeat protein